MKKRLALLLVFVFLLELVPTAFAEIGGDWNDDCRGNPIEGATAGTITYGKHNWVKQVEDPGNSCTSPGVAVYKCSYCGAYADRETPAPGHKWGGWNVTRAATCTTTGTRVRYCTVCQQQETDTIPKADHSYGSWVVLEEASCKSAGLQQRTCAVCGNTETKTISKTGNHNYGAWKVVREATCQQKGLQRRTCKTCGTKQEKSIKKAQHQYSDWVVSVEPTDHSAGVRSRSCIWCAKTEKESFDPEGTLRRGDKGSEVKEMQEILADFGYMKESQAKGTFNNTTEKAVSRFQKDNGLNADGVAWPQTRARLRHVWGDWEIVVDTTPFSAGVRRRTCSDCGKVQEEEFDPEGTLRRNDKGDDVKELQIALKGLGMFKYNTTGEFGKNTENSVKKFQKSKGLNADGIAWPGVIELLTGKKPKEPKVPATSTLPEKAGKKGTEDEKNSGDLPVTVSPIQIDMDFLGTDARKAIKGDLLYTAVRITNTGSKKVSVVSLGCPTAHAGDALDAKGFKIELESGESSDFEYGMYVTQEAFDQGYAERTFKVEAIDYETKERVAVSKPLVIGILKDGPAILLVAEDTSERKIKEGETADVTFWCVNVGDTDLTDVKLELYDEQYDTPVMDSIINIISETDFSSVWPSGSAFEFQYHVTANGEDALNKHVWRAVHASAKEAGTGKDTGVLAFFLMNMEETEKGKPGIEKLPKEKEPKLKITPHDEVPAKPVAGEYATFEVTVTNLSEMNVLYGAISYSAGDKISEEAWMKSPLEPGKSYELTYQTKILESDISHGSVYRELDAVVSDPATLKTGTAKASVDIKFIAEDKTPELPGILKDYVTLEKVITSKGVYHEGDKISYELILTNISKTETAKNVELSDVVLGLDKNFGDLMPGESVSTTCTYTVTKLDVPKEKIINTAYASWKDAENKQHHVISNTVIALTAENVDKLFSLELKKEVISTPKKFDFYQEGDEIEFRITATNTGEVTIGYVEVTDVLKKKDMGKIGEIIDLAPGKSQSFTFKYKVTKNDVSATKVVNTATAACFAAGFTPKTVISNEVECPTGVLPKDLVNGLNLVKAEVSKPKNGMFYVEGETIKYVITLINNYPVRLTSSGNWVMLGAISDLLEPAPGIIADVMDLYPGHSITVPYSYKVTAFDVGKKEVVNIATFEGEMNDDSKAQVVSNEVVSPTGVYTEKPKGGTVCVRTLHQHSASSENETLEYCVEHQLVAQEVQAIVSGAVTESDLLAAWQTAIEIWTEALNLEYQERLAQADAALAGAIQSEWVQFHLQVANCRNALIKQAGSENSAIAKQIAEMLMNHCADLCGEAGLTASQRKDSVLDAQKTVNMGLSPAKCLKQSSVIEGGISTNTVLCGDHQRTEKIVDLMLEGVAASDRETLTMVFKRAEDLWTVELDRAANERFAAADDGGAIYILERVTFGEWLNARKAMLELEYPNNPEIAQEIIARTIRERVMMICAQD